MSGMKLLVSLIGMVLILESLPYVAAPESMRDWLKQLSEMEPGVLRVLGLAALGSGLILCYLAQKTNMF